MTILTTDTKDPEINIRLKQCQSGDVIEWLGKKYLVTKDQNKIRLSFNSRPGRVVHEVGINSEMLVKQIKL
jgi:hypothetical protein